MTLLTELSLLYEQSKTIDGQNHVVGEMKKIHEEYNNIMDQVKGYF